MPASAGRVVLRLLPLAATVAWTWLTILLLLSSDPPTGGEGFLGWLPRPDLVVHFVLFGVLALLVQWTVWPVRVCRAFDVSLRFGFPVVVVGTFGVATEIAQLEVGARTGTVEDSAANILGAIAGVVFGGLVARVFGRRPARQQ